MANIHPLYRTFDIIVTEDNGLWTAECDDLGLVTEANSYEALTERSWEIAPELAELNQLGIDQDSIRLRFMHEQEPRRQAAMS